MSGTSRAVLVIDVSSRPEDELVVDGFPTLELARAYARRRARDSLEEPRALGQTPEDLRTLWSIHGEDVVVPDVDDAGLREIEFFMTHPAGAEERNRRSITRQASVRGQGEG